MMERVCKVCGGTFRHINPRAVFCSDICRKEWRKSSSRMQVEREKLARKKSPLRKVCAECGCEFEIQRSRGKVRAITCGEKCWRSRKNKTHAKCLALAPDHKKDSRMSRSRRRDRTYAAKIHAQECINALPEIEAMIAAMEKTSGQ